MKRVLLSANSDIAIYCFRREVVERLINEGYEVHIATPTRSSKRVDYLVGIGCKYYQIDIASHGKNPFVDLKLIRDYKKIMKKVQPMVVLTYTIKPIIYGGIAAKSLNIPYIANITGLGSAVENKGLLQKITVSLFKYSLKKANLVFFQNTENMQFFIDRKIALGKHYLLPGSGVNVKFFDLIDYPNDDIVEFVFIARIMKEKGIDQYLDAAKYIKYKYPNTKFHICGYCQEDYLEELKELEEKGIIEYHGLIMDVRDILKITHCTIHPTYYPEGMSNTLLESAACGRPIITTNRSGCREIIDNGINGYIINQKDSNDLISKIEMFLNLGFEEKKAMGLSGRKKVVKEFNREIVVDAYLNEIEKISKE